MVRLEAPPGRKSPLGSCLYMWIEHHEMAKKKVKVKTLEETALNKMLSAIIVLRLKKLGAKFM